MPIETSARVAFLKKIHLFYGLEDDALVDVAEELDEFHVAKDGVVVKQDSPAESFYMIYNGSVRITRRQDGKDIHLATLVRNDYFGELALVARRRRSATITAVQDTSLLVLSRDDFEKLFREHPDLKNNLEVAVKSRLLARKLQFKWLRQDEVVYFLARRHILVLYQKLIAPVFALVFPFAFLYAYFFLAPFSVVAIASVLSFIAILLWGAWQVVDWGNDYYIVTNQRVVWLEKVVGVYDSRQESPLSMVVSVGIEANQFGRFLDYGNVLVRTYVGKIAFNFVNHPNQAAKMVEEYWQRTREATVVTEKEAMKDALRRHLNISKPAILQATPVALPASEKRSSFASKSRLAEFLRTFGASKFKLRYELGENVIYRKHWVVLVLESWLPLIGMVLSLSFIVYRLFTLGLGLFIFDAWAWIGSVVLLAFAGRFGYLFWDWSNDQFEVTNEQIIDIDRKPFGTESRNFAQLDSILSTLSERHGLLGNIFNYGNVTIIVGGNKLVYEDVLDPAAVQSDIDRRRNARILKKNEAANAAERERMAEWMATYHKNVEEFKKEEEGSKNKKSE